MDLFHKAHMEKPLSPLLLVLQLLLYMELTDRVLCATTTFQSDAHDSSLYPFMSPSAYAFSYSG